MNRDLWVLEGRSDDNANISEANALRDLRDDVTEAYSLLDATDEGKLKESRDNISSLRCANQLEVLGIAQDLEI